MAGFVGLLRAVNVGGTGKLPMETLAALGAQAGFGQVRTYIASGNLIFSSDAPEAACRLALERQLAAHLGKAVPVIVRSAAEIADVAARNPFASAPGNRVMALFTDAALPADPLAGVTGRQDEQIRLGKRELFILYPRGMADTKLRMPIDKTATARNLNTVAKLAELTANIN